MWKFRFWKVSLTQSLHRSELVGTRSKNILTQQFDPFGSVRLGFIGLNTWPNWTDNIIFKLIFGSWRGDRKRFPPSVPSQRVVTTTVSGNQSDWWTVTRWSPTGPQVNPLMSWPRPPVTCKTQTPAFNHRLAWISIKWRRDWSFSAFLFNPFLRTTFSKLYTIIGLTSWNN